MVKGFFFFYKGRKRSDYKPTKNGPCLSEKNEVGWRVLLASKNPHGYLENLWATCIKQEINRGVDTFRKNWQIFKSYEIFSKIFENLGIFCKILWLFLQFFDFLAILRFLLALWDFLSRSKTFKTFFKILRFFQDFWDFFSRLLRWCFRFQDNFLNFDSKIFFTKLTKDFLSYLPSESREY